jgi:hypothetical protein
MKTKTIFFVFLTLTFIGLRGQQLLESDISIENLQYSSIDWGDYDNDGDLDILLTGAYRATSAETFAKTVIYRNDCGKFTEVSSNLLNVWYGTAKWGDYDNDKDLDIFLMGKPSGENASNTVYSKIYRNDGDTNFVDIKANILNVSSITSNCAAWGDYDNDGDIDLILTGVAGPLEYANTRIYRNDNNDVFSEVNFGLVNVAAGSVDWGDYDNDGDLDILLCGQKPDFTSQTKIYRNDSLNFTDINANIPNISYGCAKWGDFDNDGDLDILLTGQMNDGVINTLISKVYRNNEGLFDSLNLDLPVVRLSSADWGDFNNDGKIDFVYTGVGFAVDSKPITKLYLNSDMSHFIESDNLLKGVNVGDSKWGDYDNDGDLDLLITGGFTILYNNNLVQDTLMLIETICDGENYKIEDSSFSQTGNYLVTLTNRFGCDSIVKLSLTVNSCIDNLAVEANFPKNIKVFPNPTSGILYIKTGDKYDIKEIQILSVTGQIIFTKNYKSIDNKNIQEIDLTGYMTGQYIIRIISDKIVRTERLIIKN